MVKLRVELTYSYEHSFNVGKTVETTSIDLPQFNVDEPTLFQHWSLVKNESWAEVCLSALLQRWQNNIDRITLIQCLWLMRFQRWYLVENGSWVNICSSTLLRRWESNVETTFSIFVALLFTRQWLNNKTELSFQA